MDAEKKTEGIGQKKADGDPDTGNNSETNSLVERADAAAERLETANKERKALLDREEQIMARKTLGGQSEGPRQPEKPKELTDKEFKDKFLKGEIENPFR